MDYIFNQSVSGSTITGTSENDSIYFSGSASSVSVVLGEGSDIVNFADNANQIVVSGAGESNDISIETFTGTNTIRVANESSSSVSVKDLDRATLMIYQTNSAGVNRVSVDSVTGTNIFFMSVSGSATNEVSIGNVIGSGNFFAIDLGPGNASFGSNNDQIAIGKISDSNDFHMWLDGGNDSLSVESIGKNVSLGAVAINSLTVDIGSVSDGGHFTFLGGNQANNISIKSLGASSYLNADLQDGNDRVEIGNIGNNSNITLQSNGGSDVIRIGNVQGNLEITAENPKHINRVDTSRNPGIVQETFDSTVEFNGIDLKIASIGSNSSVNIIGGSDSDQISIDAVSSDANISINTGAGDDYINVASGANLLITYESGNDTIDGFDSKTTLVATGSLATIESGFEVSTDNGKITILTDSFLNSDSNGNIVAGYKIVDIDSDGDSIFQISRAGSVDGGSGNDFFSISSAVDGNVSLTGGSDSDVFYAQSSSVSSSADQSRITITDLDFNSGDVVLIDTGVSNLDKHFFGAGKFYNYANAQDASTSGVYAGTIFDASDLVSNLGMSFSIVKMADSNATLDDENSIDEDSITNVIWANSNSATIDFSSTQTDSVLIFTDTNSRGDLVSLGGDFDDTIHAGINDTIDAGAGDDLIYLSKKNHVVFGSSEGDDTVYGWNSTDTLDLNSIPNVSILSDGLYLESENETMLIDGSFTNSTNIRYNDGIMRVADSSGRVEYNKNVTYYAGSTLIMNSSSNNTIDLSSSTYQNISAIDASNATGRDTFRYTSDAGNVTISNGDSRDVVDLSNYTIDEISTQFTDTGLVITIDDSNLNIIGTNLTQFSLASGKYTADFSNQTFSE